MTWTVRPAVAADRPGVLDLVRDAFRGVGPGGRPHDGEEEAEIVDRTWELGAAPAELDLVAVEDGGLLIGHVLAAPGALRQEEQEGEGLASGSRRVLAVAPLAVLPSRQRQGVGTSLMREVMVRAGRSGAVLMLVLGDPRYYRRFGFESAGTYGIFHPPADLDDPHFMIRRFGNLGEGWRGGAFVYCWEDAPGATGAR